MTAQGKLTTTCVNNLQAAWNTFAAAMVTSSYPLVVASYKNATKELVLTPVAELATATQRRRQVR